MLLFYDSLCFIIINVYVYTVPALHKEPDIQVLDDNNETQFALIEHGKVHNCKWDTDDLGQDDFTETEPEFSIENWLFLPHPSTQVSRWIPRHSTNQKDAFTVVTNDPKNGFFSFKQETKAFAKFQFGLSIVAVKKKTENLEIFYTSSFLSFVPNVLGSGRDAIKNFCRDWRDKTVEIIDHNTLISCPCTLESAKMNPLLDVDFTCSATELDCHENVNAHRCFLVSVNGT